VRGWLAGLGPVQLLALFFVAAICVGTVLLLLPFSTTEPISLVDAAFTATSAVCVTGLIVVETGSRFTPFGQGVVLLLIQFGGLGIMATSTFVLLTLGNRSSLRNLIMLRGEYTVSGVGSARRLLLIVGGFTLIAEVAGAFVLSRRFGGVEGLEHHHVWAGIFHSISAFCNAGFSLFQTSFQEYRADLTINLMVPGLIIFGGIGFPALIDVYNKFRLRLRGIRVKLSLHAKIVFIATIVLLVLGTAGFFAFQRPRIGPEEASVSERATVAWFQSVTTRTAGFNTLDFGEASDATGFLALVLMVIGGSPGSTAGGIKTTTLVVILLVVLARLRGHERVEVGRRTIPAAVITKALVVAVLGVLLVVFATMLLLITDGPARAGGQDLEFVELLFEVVSAFGTVGLSMLTTAETGALTWGGKLIIICVMYLGRLGPLALAQMVFTADKSNRYQYPEEYLLVG